MRRKLATLGLVLGLFVLMGATCTLSSYGAGGMMPGVYSPPMGGVMNPGIYSPSPSGAVSPGTYFPPMPMGGMMGY